MNIYVCYFIFLNGIFFFLINKLKVVIEIVKFLFDILYKYL